MDLIRKIEADIQKHNVHVSQEEWNHCISFFTEKKYRKKSRIFSQTDLCEEVLFIADGIASSEYVFEDGKSIISRFFVENNLCSNIVSATTKQLASDNIVAITSINAISIPFKVFYHYYLKEGKMGEYFRIKILDTLLEDKSFISMKTVADTEVKYRFLEKEYPDIIQFAPAKDIASFIGITPEGLSRFLKKRYKKLNPG